MQLPEGWTDDMTFPIGNGKTAPELGEWLMDTFEERWSYEKTTSECMRLFGVSEDDAHLAQDRAMGGIARALTANRANEPDSTKDPLAYYTFQRVWESLPRNVLFKRKPGGKWSLWYAEAKNEGAT